MTVVAKTRDGVRLKPSELTRHIVGADDDPIFIRLAIEADEGEDGVVLVYCGEDGEALVEAWVADVDGALERAEIEFGITRADWVFLH